MTLVYFDGVRHIRDYQANASYGQLAMIARAFPPAYIWHIE